MSPHTPPGTAEGRKQRLFLRVEEFGRRRWRLMFLLGLLSIALGTLLGSRLHLESDVLKLIPRGNRQIDTFKTALRDFGAIDLLLVMIEAGDGEGPDEIEDFADSLAERLRSRVGLVESVEYRFQPDEKFLELFSDNALLFLPPEQLPEIARKLSDEEIRRQVRENRLELASPAATLTEGLVLRDPLGLMPFFVDRLLSHRGAFKLDLSDGYYLSRDGGSLLMLVKPSRPSQDLAFDRQLLEAVRSDADAARRELRADGTECRARLRLAGNHALILEEASLLRSTILRNLWISFIAVTGLYFLCYRRFSALFYSSLPLMVGQALTFAVAWAVLGSLNSASSALPALLMGLGTDFTIVMYARYVEERRLGVGVAEATRRMTGEAGLGVFLGAITSAGTFYAMCVGSFRGLRDLGFLIGTGIVLCAVSILFLMPAMIYWNEQIRLKGRSGLRRLHLQSFGLERLITLSARRPSYALAVVALLAGFGGWRATHLDFDDSINALRSNRSEALGVQHAITERFGASLSYMMAIAEGRTVDEAVERSRRIQERLAPFVADGTVGSYESILTYLPPVERQRRVLERIASDSSVAFNPRRVQATFLAALDENGFRHEPFAAYVRRLEHLISPPRPVTLDDLVGQGLGRMVDRFVHRAPGDVRIVTYVYTTDARWKREAPPGLVEALSGGDPGIVVTGTNVLSRELRRLFVRDSLRAVALGLALVAVLLYLDFRRLRLTLVALAQLVTGVVMMLGAMELFGVPINFANAFVATMIMGVGIDYSIHLVLRMDRNRGRVDEGVLETGKAVVIAALTNVAGFGTLTLGQYPAMRSFGLVALLGSVCCLLTALTLVPAALARREPDPADEIAGRMAA